MLAAHGDAFVAETLGRCLGLGPGDDDDDDDPVPIGDPPDDDEGDDQDDDDEDEDDEEPMQVRRCASPYRQRARITAQCRPDDRSRAAVPVARYPIPDL
ncbi:MAG TPA: hypothetical protein VFO53_01010 [Casimicrobiaceae bacterium]|nr:hypothetical protein [Casimicrobiaceae bacterium]